MNSSNSNATSAATSAATTSTSTSTSTSKPRRYYALRKGRSTRFCIYVRWDDLCQQLDDFVSAEYDTFDRVEDALRYITVGLPKLTMTSTSPSTSPSTSIPATTLTSKSTATSLSSSSSKSFKFHDQHEADHQAQGYMNDVMETTITTNAPVITNSASNTHANTNKSGNAATSSEIEEEVRTRVAAALPIPVLAGPSLSMSTSTASSKVPAASSATNNRGVVSVYTSSPDTNDPENRHCADNSNDNATSSSSCTSTSRESTQRNEHSPTTTETIVTEATATAAAAINEQQQQQQQAVVPVYVDNWTEMFELFKRHKENNHTMDNVKKNSKLGRWMAAQRLAYKKLNNLGTGKDAAAANDNDNDDGDTTTTSSASNNDNNDNNSNNNPMTGIQLQKLATVGFDFTDPPKKKRIIILTSKETEQEWNKMYQELKKFREENNHCVPPVKNNTPLRRWFEKQRNEYRKIRAGEPSHLTTQRLQLLNDINFQFEPTRKPKSWDERFDELVVFKANFGHTKVPRLYGTLGKWVSDQRVKYRNMLKGKKSNMTAEKARRLDEIGMIWAVITLPPPEKRAERRSWSERYEELLEFKAKYGHTVVPQHYFGLGNWVHTQRVNYKLMKQGRKSLMTPSQALQLVDAGFTFEVMPRKKKQKIRQSLGNPYPHLPLIANRDDLERFDSKEDDDNNSEKE